MKEIDFLPDSYKSGKKWRLSLRNQCIGLAIILAALVVWDVTDSYRLEKQQVILEQRKPQKENALAVSRELQATNNRIEKLRKQAKLLESLNSKVSVPNLLGELSYILGRDIVLNKLSIKEEAFASAKGEGKNTEFIVRSVAGQLATDSAALEPVRYKIEISGLAGDSADVAGLIQRMENSEYFYQVYPAYSKNKELKIKDSHDEQPLNVSEFAIGCYLANYKQKQLAQLSQ